MAVVQRAPSGDLPEVFSRMRRAVPGGTASTATTAADPAGLWIAGHITLSARTTDYGLRAPHHGHWSTDHERRTTTSHRFPVFLNGRLDGVVYSGGAERPDPTALVREAYRQHGPRLGERLEGDFAALLVDNEMQRLLLVTGVTGSYPTYWTLAGGRLCLAPSVSAICRALGVAPTPDLRAAADYVHYGFVFGNKTLAEGIELVPAGATLVYDWRNGTVDVLQHHRPGDLFEQASLDRREYMRRVHEEFNHAVRSACVDADELGLSLSGGLDSRAILSAIDTATIPLRTYTVGVRRCADDVIGAKLARIAKTTHTFFELGEEYLKEFLPNLERMIALTDGMYLSHGLTEILALQAVQQAGIRTLLRGHCGELAKMHLAWPFHTDPQVYGMNRAEYVPYFHARVNYVSPGLDPTELFQAGHENEVRDAARQSLEEAIGPTTLSAPELCGYLYFTEHHRRFTIPSLELFRTSVEVRLPFADPRFLRALLCGRHEWRDGVEIHQHITSSNSPLLARVRNSNTGAPGNASPLVEKLLDPVNSLLKRLNAPGFRHYHHFDAWMRRELLTSVTDVLLDGMTERRGIVRTSTVRRLLDATRTGVFDHAYLLQVLLIIELWHRQNSAAVATHAA
jgi:asparagine synthase (glutamine-hydrolysing)